MSIIGGGFLRVTGRDLMNKRASMIALKGLMVQWNPFENSMQISRLVWLYLAQCFMKNANFGGGLLFFSISC